jgi:hypothetical protein
VVSDKVRTFGLWERRTGLVRGRVGSPAYCVVTKCCAYRAAHGHHFSGRLDLAAELTTHKGALGHMQEHNGDSSQKDHTVVFVDAGELPDGSAWMFVEFGGSTHFILDRAQLTEATLEDAWAGYRAMGRWIAEDAGGHEPVAGCCPLAGHPLALVRSA